jgi:hypothetical protein
MSPLWPILALLLVAVIAVALFALFEARHSLQFSLRHVFYVITYLSLLLAVAGEDDFGVLFLPLTFGFVALSLLGIIYRRGERRAYWVGFCIFGVVYVLALKLVGISSHDFVESFFLAPHLPLSVLGAYLARYFYRTQDAPEPSDP